MTDPASPELLIDYVVSKAMESGPHQEGYRWIEDAWMAQIPSKGVEEFARRCKTLDVARACLDRYADAQTTHLVSKGDPGHTVITMECALSLIKSHPIDRHGASRRENDRPTDDAKDIRFAMSQVDNRTRTWARRLYLSSSMAAFAIT